MTDPRQFEADLERQAVASFTGVVYQAWLSIDAWLRLRDDDQVIFLEGAEDFDRIGGAGPDIAVQARHTIAPISLGNAKARNSLENFWTLSEREGDRVVHMHYLTTSSPTHERDGTFGDLTGIDAWRVARTNSDVARAVAAYVSGKLDASSPLRGFLNATSPEILQERLFKRFHWFTDHPGIEAVQRSVEDRLVSVLARLGRSPRFASNVRPHLESKFWATVTEKEPGMRQLTHGGLLRVIDEALTTYLPLPVERASEMLGLALPGASLLSLLRQKVPLPPSPLLARIELVDQLKSRIDERHAVLLTGSVFKGKTTLAQLVASLVCPGAWWVPLRGYTLNQVDMVLLALAREVDTERCPSLIVIDDLDVSASAYQVLAPSLSLFLHRALGSGRGVILTAKGASSNIQAFSSIASLQIFSVPELSENEVKELCVAAGCPVNKSAATALFTRARTAGHPKLVQIRLAELAKAGWVADEIAVLTGESPGTQSTRQLSRGLLRESVSPALCELVYAAADANTLLHRTVMLALAVRVGIRTPGDALDALNGTWLECIEDNWFRVTALLQGAAAEVWTASEREKNHLRLHDAIQSKGILSPIEAAALLFHAYQGKGWKRIAVDSMKLQIIDDPKAQREVLSSLFWLPFIALAAGEKISGDAVSGAALRSIQFRAAEATESETITAICDRWIEEAECLPAGDLREGMLASMWGAFLAAESKWVPLKYRLAAVQLLPVVNGMVGEVIEEGLRNAFKSNGEIIGVPADPAVICLMILLAARWVKDDESLLIFLEWLEENASEELQAGFEEILDWPFTQAMGAIVHGAWVGVDGNTSDWNYWLEIFDKINNYSIKKNSPRFGIEAAKAKSIILSEKLDQPQVALQVLSSAKVQFGDSPILQEQWANVLFLGEDDEGVLRIWEGLQEGDSPTTLNDPYAYRRAAISAAKLQRWPLSITMFESGAVRASAIGLELTSFAMLADSALSQFYGGDVKSSIASLFYAVKQLPHLASLDGELRWEAVQRTVYDICSFIDNATSGNSRVRRRVMSGDVSSPFQKMDRTEPGQELRTLNLRVIAARLAARHGIISEKLMQEICILKKTPYPIVQFNCAEAFVSFSLANDSDQFVEAIKSLDHSLACLTRLGERGDKIFQPQESHGLVEPTGVGWFELIVAGAWISGEKFQDRLNAWLIEFEASSFSAIASGVSDLIMGASGTDVEVEARLADFDLGLTIKCGAALRLLQTAKFDKNRHLLHTFLLSWMSDQNNSRLQCLWNLAIARKLADEWRLLVENPFLLASPRNSIIELSVAMKDIHDGRGTSRTIQSAINRALVVSLPHNLHTDKLW